MCAKFIQSKQYAEFATITCIDWNPLLRDDRTLSWPGTAVPLNAATESWIEQIVTIPTGATTLQAGVVWGTVTSGEVLYINEFEIIKLETTTPEYQYNLKDHLGNVRLTFTSKQETESATATLETANANAESGKFINYTEAIKVNHAIWDHTNAGATTYATRLTGANTNAIYGLAKSLSVMPGDVVNMQVYAKYLDTNTANWTTALNNFITSIANGTAPVGTLVDGGAAGSLGAGASPISPINHTAEAGTPPKAYLNYIVFNKDMTTVLNSGFSRITTNSREYGQDCAHDLLSLTYTVKEPGYIYIYLSNENATAVEVYFDDFKVDHIKSPVIQMDDYYAFGLTYNSYSRENSVENKYLFNGGSELQTDLNLGFYSTLFRTYDPAIGRFMQIDPLADFFAGITPYSFAFDNPISYSDPDGLAPLWWLKLRANIKQIGYNLTGRKQYHAAIVGRHKGHSLVVQSGLSNWKTHKPAANPRTEQVAKTYAKEEPQEEPKNEPQQDPVVGQVPEPEQQPDPIPTFRDKQIPPGNKINYSERIQFNSKTDKFTDSEVVKSQLDDLVKLLMNNTGISVYIAGNVFKSTGATGNSEEALSESVTLNGTKTNARTLMNARAQAVYDFLISQGVDPKQLVYGPGNVIPKESGLKVSFEIRNK